MNKNLNEIISILGYLSIILIASTSAFKLLKFDFIGLSVYVSSEIENIKTERNANTPFTPGLFQDPFSEKSFDGAVIDGVNFIFYEDVTQYAQNEELLTISNELLNGGSIIYEIIDPKFIDENSILLISSALEVNNKTVSPSDDYKCIEPTIVYTTLDSNVTYSDSCIVFEANITQAFSLANGLTYHLIKDLN